MKRSVKKFFQSKTVLRPYLFEVSFPSSNELSTYTNNIVSFLEINPILYKKFQEYTNGFLSDTDTSGAGILKSWDLKPYSVKSINIPNFSFQKELVKVGPFSKMMPVMNFDGYELSLELSESKGMGIYRFISWLQSRQIFEDGWFWPEKLAAIPFITIDVFKTHDSDEKVATITYEDIMFLQSTEAQFNYSDNTPVSYTLTFNANVSNVKYYSN
tara:strand:- start:1289 stop:1930 length:642 start_codon:yes stop_codon:yes gene_type:complete